MRKEDIIKLWYPNETLSDDEVKAIYDNLLNLFLILYQEINVCDQESQIHDVSWYKKFLIFRRLVWNL